MRLSLSFTSIINHENISDFSFEIVKIMTTKAQTFKNLSDSHIINSNGTDCSRNPSTILSHHPPRPSFPNPFNWFRLILSLANNGPIT